MDMLSSFLHYVMLHFAVVGALILSFKMVPIARLFMRFPTILLYDFEVPLPGGGVA